MGYRHRESPYPMISIEEATGIITAHMTPLESEAISSLYAEGRVLAEDIHAGESIPDVAKSAVDGYALRSVDGMAERRVQEEISAGGTSSRELSPETAVRLMTGAPVPPGADAVIMVEQTDEQEGMLRIQRPVRPGENVRQVGEDVVLGEPVLARGTTLSAAEIGLLASLGQSRICVYRRPRVAVLATGSEVVEPDAPCGPGMVRDSNRYAQMAALREAGCEAISLGIAHDDEQVQREALQRGLDMADVLITSGGISMGTRDLIKPLLNEMGAVHFGRTAFKPGKPVTFATVQGKPVFALPGFPVSALVAFEVYVRPALRRLQGDARPERPRIRVALADPVRAPRDRPEYQRAVVYWEDGRLLARSTGQQRSSRLLSLRGANALIIVHPGEQIYEPGTELDALLTGPLAVQ